MAQSSLPLRIEFNRLPRRERERLVAATQGSGVPPIIAERAGVYGAAIGWIVFAAILLVLGSTMLAHGYGDPWAELLGAGWLVVTIGIAFVTAVAVLDTIYRVLRRRRRPYAAGRYLFPVDYIDASEEPIQILPLGALENFGATHNHTNGVYTNTVLEFTFSGGLKRNFTISGKQRAEDSINRLSAQRRALAAAVQANDMNGLDALDVFANVRMREGLEACVNTTTTELHGGPLVRPMPKILARRFLAALAIGAVVGGLGLLLRNLASDQAAWNQARKTKTVDALEAYLNNGWRHLDEARVLAADTAFAQCQQQPSEASCALFVEHYPEHPQHQQAKSDLLPRAALKDATDDPAQMREFLRRYPGSVVEAEARSQLHAAFVTAFDKFKTQANGSSRELLPFVERLLAFLEQADDGLVDVRFRLIESESLHKADETLQAALADGKGGTFVAVTPYFSAEKMGAYEEQTVASLRQAFGSIFTSSLLDFRAGTALTEAEAQPAQIRQRKLDKRPELDVLYTVDWSGATYTNNDQSRSFVGISFSFLAIFSVPGHEADPLQFTLDVEPPDEFSVSFSQYADRLGDGPGDAAVYQVMGLRAFDQFGDKLRGVFFRQDSAAFKEGRPGEPAEGGD